MASQGGRFSAVPYRGGKRCLHCGKRARWVGTCSPEFFTLIVDIYLCGEHHKACLACTAKNKPVKSALDL